MQRGVGTEESITAWLQDWTDGDREAGEQLFALVYPELKKLAGRFLARERAGAPEIGTWHSGWRLFDKRNGQLDDRKRLLSNRNG